MKIALTTFAVLMSAVMAWAKELPANGLLIYREPSGTYVEALRFSSFTPGGADSVVLLVGGTTMRVWNSGIVAKFDYPPANTAAVSLDNATLMLGKAREMAARFPNCQAQINEIVKKWTNAESFARAAVAAENRSGQIARSSALTLQVKATKYEQATLSAVGSDSATIMHAGGVAKIPLSALRGDQIVALNASSASVKIDPDWQTKRAASEAMAVEIPPNNAPKTENGVFKNPTKSVVASFGDSEAAFVAQYGRAKRREIFVDNQTGETTEGISFEKNGFDILVSFVRGNVTRMTFSKKALIREEVRIILEKYKDGGDWTENEDPVTAKWSLVRSDGEAYAFISGSVHDVQMGIDVGFVSIDSKSIVNKYAATRLAEKERVEARRERSREKQAKWAEEREMARIRKEAVIKKKAEGL